MIRVWVGGWIVALACIGACASPSLTHCPDVDCPANEVCDGHGGCAGNGHRSGFPMHYVLSRRELH